MSVAVLDVAPLTTHVAIHDLIADLAAALTRMRHDMDQSRSEIQWAMAELYVRRRRLRLIDQSLHEEGQKATPQVVNRLIRSQPGYEGPGNSFLSRAWSLAETFPDIYFCAGAKSFWTLSRLSDLVTRKGLSIDTKRELRRRAEVEGWTRQRLREEIDRCSGEVPRPDFDLKYGNCWRFSEAQNRAGFDGGIHPDLVANILYYFSKPGDTILDPMAGGGTTARALAYRYFQTADPALPGSGPRQLIAFDSAPVCDGVFAHDARQPFPVESGSVDLVIWDPPYYKMAEDKYDAHSDGLDQWIGFINRVLDNLIPLLRLGGRIVVITDDYLTSQEKASLAVIVGHLAMMRGLFPLQTITNAYPHFVASMGPLEMARVKKAKLTVNQAKYINVYLCPAERVTPRGQARRP